MHRLGVDQVSGHRLASSPHARNRRPQFISAGAAKIRGLNREQHRFDASVFGCFVEPLHYSMQMRRDVCQQTTLPHAIGNRARQTDLRNRRNGLFFDRFRCSFCYRFFTQIFCCLSPLRRFALHHPSGHGDRHDRGTRDTPRTPQASTRTVGHSKDSRLKDCDNQHSSLLP